jgi:hypothetical protein
MNTDCLNSRLLYSAPNMQAAAFLKLLMLRIVAALDARRRHASRKQKDSLWSGSASQKRHR